MYKHENTEVQTLGAVIYDTWNWKINARVYLQAYIYMYAVKVRPG